MNIEKETARTISKYKLLNKKENIVVALSGGKDSTSILYILKKLNYNVQGLMIDLNLGNWSKTHNKNMETFCKKINVKLTIVDLKKELGQGICFIKSILKQKKNLTGCTVCGTIKKWILNKWAKKLKADKIVTGHNLDDEAQNILMNFLKGNIFLGINSAPVTGDPAATKKGFVQRVKPFFFIPESEIKKYSLKKKFKILYDKCPCAFGTYRVETRELTKKITNSEKLKIVKNFQPLANNLRKTQIKELRNCEICKEPSASNICNACKIFQEI